jgi:hypothetical protein
MGDQTVHLYLGRGWFIEHSTHLHHRHVPEERHQREKESVAKSMQHSVTMQKTYVVMKKSGKGFVEQAY